MKHDPVHSKELPKKQKIEDSNLSNFRHVLDQRFSMAYAMEITSFNILKKENKETHSFLS